MGESSRIKKFICGVMGAIMCCMCTGIIFGSILVAITAVALVAWHIIRQANCILKKKRNTDRLIGTERFYHIVEGNVSTTKYVELVTLPTENSNGQIVLSDGSDNLHGEWTVSNNEFVMWFGDIRHGFKPIMRSGELFIQLSFVDELSLFNGMEFIRCDSVDSLFNQAAVDPFEQLMRSEESYRLVKAEF